MEAEGGNAKDLKGTKPEGVRGGFKRKLGGGWGCVIYRMAWGLLPIVSHELKLHRTPPGSPGDAGPQTTGEMIMFVLHCTVLALGISMFILGMLVIEE